MSMTGNAAAAPGGGGGGGRSLGPGWRSGKGFQPPGPAVAAAAAGGDDADHPSTAAPSSPTSRNRSGSHATAGSHGSNSGGGGWSEVVAKNSGAGSNINHFAALDMDEDDAPPSSSSIGGKTTTSNGSRGGGGSSSAAAAGVASPSRRSEALRHSGSSSFGPAGKRSGRSLADLAATLAPSDQGGAASRRGGGAGSGGAAPRGGSGGGRGGGSGGSGDHHHRPTKSSTDYDMDKTVIRYTREKLLSLRPPVNASTELILPDKLKHLEGVSVISDKANDPVCFDTFDPDEIWAQAVKERRAAASVGGIKGDGGGGGGGGPPPGVPRGFGGNRWQRGVALPKSDGRGGGRSASAAAGSDPDDLWDDPTDGPTSAASDFSAFGGSLDDVPRAGGGSSSSGLGTSGFDLSDMSEAAKRFEEELHGKGGSSSGELGAAAGTDNADDAHTRKIDSHRPLASTGTEIRSGSGDDVNVFEDFGEPNVEDASAETGGIASGGEKSASSRLMEMIGVGGASSGGAGGGAGNEPVAKEPAQAAAAPEGTVSGAAAIGGVPLNPWGEPMVQQQQQPPTQGMDLAARLADEQRTRQRQEEEARRRAQMERQQQEAAARQAQQQQQQQQGPSQVELILMERVSAILENSWGRSDLLSILSTLHSEDSRVIPLLGNVDALRALIARHPRRVQLAKDPAFGAEMAVLLLSNSQWQQAKAQEEEQQRAQQEELNRQQMMQQRMAQNPPPALIPNAPWFYTDPNGQVQGPFGGNEMRQWLEAGYFKGDLPISQNPNASFRALGHIFPDLETAFQVPEQQPVAPEPPVPAMVEEAPVPLPSSPVRAPVEEPKPEVMAAPEPKPEPAPVAASIPVANADPDQSSQLKAMLGVGGGGGGDGGAPPAKQTTKKEKKKKEKAAKAPKNVPEADSSSAAATASAPAAWGGAAAGKAAGKKKTMSEIQQEEARVAARRAREQPSGGTGGGGWANVAATGGTTAWTGDAVKPTPGVVAPAPQRPVAAAAQQGRPRQQPQAAAAAAQSNKSGKASSNKQTADEFGESGKMSPELERWSREQMKKISGSDDLTLVSFCMTLNDSSEIKQYLTAYLGSTPQVNNFASEFINRKDGKKAQQEKWESAGAGKKGRKKKGGRN